MNVCFRNLQNLGKLKSDTMKYYPILLCHNLPANHPSDSDPFMSMKSLSHTFQYIFSVKKWGFASQPCWSTRGCIFFDTYNIVELPFYLRLKIQFSSRSNLQTWDLWFSTSKTHGKIPYYWNPNQIRWLQKIPSAQARSLNGQGTAVGSPRAPPWGLSTSLVGQGDPHVFFKLFLGPKFSGDPMGMKITFKNGIPHDSTI